MALKEQGFIGGAASGAATGFQVGGPWGAVIGGVGGGVLGYLSAAAQAKSEEERSAMINAAKAEYDNIKDPATKALVFPELKQMGVLTPEEEIAFTVPESAMAGVSTDPRLQQAQYSALAKLAQLGEGGVTQAEQLDIERARRSLLADQAAQQSAIQESMARRGVASGGMEAVMRQQAAQEAANKTLDYEAQTQAAAQRRALEAIMSRGELAGNVRTQEFGEGETKAKARDAINEFNARLAADAQMRNVASRNVAAQQNLAERQRLAEYNAMRDVESQKSQNELAQQAYTNEINRLGGKYGQTLQPSLAASKDAAATRSNMYSQLGGAFGVGAKAYGDYQASQPKKSGSYVTEYAPVVDDTEDEFDMARKRR